MSHFCSPLRYPGGKNCIFPFVSKLFHENNLIGCTYAEPYAGGAGLALRLLYDEYVEKIYINDFDLSIFSFWKAVLDRNEDFCAWLESVPVTLDTWHESKAVQIDPEGADQFDLAKATFFLNRTNVSGVIKGGIIGGYKQEGKYKIDARFNKIDLIQRITKIKAFRKRIALSNLDGIEFVRKLNRRKEDVFLYLDPPYYKKGSDLYMNFYCRDDHLKLSRYVAKMKKKWMVSYDNHEFILNLYKDQSRVMYQLSQSASNRVGDEILIFSPALLFSNSIKHLNAALPV